MRSPYRLFQRPPPAAVQDLAPKDATSGLPEFTRAFALGAGIFAALALGLCTSQGSDRASPPRAIAGALRAVSASSLILADPVPEAPIEHELSMALRRHRGPRTDDGDYPPRNAVGRPCNCTPGDPLCSCDDPPPMRQHR